jgi:hypothetical protein
MTTNFPDKAKIDGKNDVVASDDESAGCIKELWKDRRF